MDGVEKRVFRRKHALLRSLLQPTSTYMALLKLKGLVSADMEKAVLATESRKQMTTLLTLMESGPDTTMNKFTFMLEQAGYSWVADEIAADLLYEQGKLPLEDHILEEAQYHANTLFGDKKYLEIRRKGDLVKCIASRNQVAKEAWNRQMSRKNKHVVDELQSVQKDVLRMFEEVDEFLKVKNKLSRGTQEDGQGGKCSHGSKVGAKGSPKKRPNEKDIGNISYSTAIKLLQDKIGTLNHALENEISQHEELYGEREKCYELLNAEPNSGPLDDVLNEALQKFARELGQKSTDSESKKKQVTSLDHQVRGLRQDLTSQISQKNAQLDQLNRAMKQTERLLKDARENFSDMTHKRDICLTQVAYWKDRCEMLEKTKRLGYYHMSKVSQPVSLANPHAIPGTNQKRPLYYDPDLLEVVDNVVYIKGDDTMAKKLGHSRKSDASQNNRSPSKPVMIDNFSTPRPVSKYHTKCIPSDDYELNSSNNNNNTNDKCINFRNTSSGNGTPNSRMPQKSSLKSTSVSDETTTTASNQRYSANSVKKQLSFSTKTYENESIKTEGLNVSPYNTHMLPVYPYLGQSNVTTTTSKGSGVHRYEVNQPQTLPSGIYRPAPPPSTTPRKEGIQSARSYGSTKYGRKSTVPSNAYVTYTNGIIGLNEATQTNSVAHSNQQNGQPTKTPKEKFEDSLKGDAVQSANGPSQSNTRSHPRVTSSGTNQSNVGTHGRASSVGLNQSYSSSYSGAQSSGYSSMTSAPMSETELSMNGSVQSGTHKGVHNGKSTGADHCRCCKACCREAPTHHPYQEYIS